MYKQEMAVFEEAFDLSKTVLYILFYGQLKGFQLSLFMLVSAKRHIPLKVQMTKTGDWC